MRKFHTRFLAVLFCAAMVLSMSVCAGADGKKEADIEEILAGMTLREKVEQMMVVSYRVWKEVPETDSGSEELTAGSTEQEIPAVNVTELNDEIRDALREHHYGGTILFAENYQDAEQVVRLVADLQQTTIEGGGLPLFVATDQEGGNVARVTFGTTGVGNMALAATGDPENARKMAAIYGEELSLLGVNTDFAPVVDINNNSDNPVIGVRSFSDSPEVVAEYGLRYLDGLHAAETIATIKHFPGHGNTDTDSHTGFPCIESSYEELQQCELIPFQAAVDAGVDMVMTAHIQYPEIETDTYTSIASGEEVYLPATMSERILTDILRDDMGFEGVIVSDALDMAAITDNFATEDVLCMTINAGVNLLLLPQVYDSSSFRQVLDMTNLAVELAEEGKISTERIDDSVQRILALKKQYGLLDQTDFTVTDSQISAAEEGVGSAAHREAAWEIAGEALTILKNENDAFPVKAMPGETALILFADSCASRVGTGELAIQKLTQAQAIPEDVQITVMVNDADNEEECVQAAAEADHVVLVYRTYGAACLDPKTDDGFSSAVFDRIIAQRHEAGKQSVVVSSQLPYDAARFEAADAILLTYNSAVMRVIPPETGEGSAYAPNLAAALTACFGEEEVSGKLPVDIPALDENYGMTDEILYAREVSATSSQEDSDVNLSDDASDFVLLSEAVPDAILEIRYYSTYNFVGERIDGYEEPLALLTKEAASALKEVSDDLIAQGYRLKIFDAYRPQEAVTHFMNWALDPDDTRMKEYFYPELDKDVLFPQGYIAEHSGHSRGSTVDLTLFDMALEKEVDMGGTFDYFGELSHPDYTDITQEQYANRMILREAMLKHGFRPLAEEWWHFTLEDEPYPDTYFTFPVNSESVEGNDNGPEDAVVEAVYLGVKDYGLEETNKENRDQFLYRFDIDGQECTYRVSNGTKDEEGNYDYPIQNLLKEGDRYTVTIEGGIVTAVEEMEADKTAYEPVVQGIAGERTLKNFLKTALGPVGTTLYLYGGGWDWQDEGSSVQARTIGISPDWVSFFERMDADYTYKEEDGDETKADPEHSYYPYGGYNEYYYAGLDCSGYLGWVLYNTFETESGEEGYVGGSTGFAKRLAEKGFGEWTQDIVMPDGQNGYEMKPGDIMSINGHVWISLGTCGDGSVVIAHSTPSMSRTGQPGGGVQISAVGWDEDCEAYGLAEQYMAQYYPEWYERYPIYLCSPDKYFTFEGENAGRFTWAAGEESEGLRDPEGIQEQKPEEVLKILFE